MLDIFFACVRMQSRAGIHLLSVLSLVDYTNLKESSQRNETAFQAVEFDWNGAALLSNRSICWLWAEQGERAMPDTRACQALWRKLAF